MKKTYYILLILNLFNLSAQTKKIAYKSHSGNMLYFKENILNDFKDTNFSNFGEAPTPEIKNAKLDSIIYLDDTRTIIVTSEFCKWHKNDEKEFLWKKGKDTLINNPYFERKNKKHIRKILKSDFHFKNNIDSVVIIDKTKSNTYQLKKSIKKQTKHSLKPKILKSSISTNNYNIAYYVFVLLITVMLTFYVYFGKK